MDGAQLHGTTFLGAGKHKLQYNAYAGTFEDNSNDVVFGGRAAYSLAESGVTVGLNGGHGERAATLSKYDLYGVDVNIDKGPLLIQGEYFGTSENVGGSRQGYYVQPAWRFSPK